MRRRNPIIRPPRERGVPRQQLPCRQVFILRRRLLNILHRVSRLTSLPPSMVKVSEEVSFILRNCVLRPPSTLQVTWAGSVPALPDITSIMSPCILRNIILSGRSAMLSCHVIPQSRQCYRGNVCEIILRWTSSRYGEFHFSFTHPALWIEFHVLFHFFSGNTANAMQPMTHIVQLTPQQHEQSYPGPMQAFPGPSLQQPQYSAPLSPVQGQQYAPVQLQQLQQYSAVPSPVQQAHAYRGPMQQAHAYPGPMPQTHAYPGPMQTFPGHSLPWPPVPAVPSAGKFVGISFKMELS